MSLPAQLSNPVLSLSKHAWSARPALRQAQGAVVGALALRCDHESVLSLAGIMRRNDQLRRIPLLAAPGVR